MKGVVRFFSGKKGYGFIYTEDLSPAGDIFFHVSQIIPNGDKRKIVGTGDEVEFNPEEGKRGLEAHNVKVTKKGEFKNEMVQASN